MQKISIIIPVYKVESYLSECLDSVIGQTYKNLEIILIDDGSPDNCGVICDKYAEEDSRIIVIHKENEGVSAARNDGLKRVTGDWITFIDSDDWIEPDYCENFIQFASKHKADMIFLGGLIEENSGDESLICRSVQSEFVYTKADHPKKWETLQAKVFSIKLSDDHLSNQCSWGVVCSAFHSAHFWKGKKIMFSTELIRLEDSLFNFMMIEKADSIGVLPYIGYHYRKTNIESVSYRYISGKINSLSLYIQKLCSEKDFTKMKLLSEAISAVILRDLFRCLEKDYFHAENPKKNSEIRKELLKLKQEPYIQQAVWQKGDCLLTKKERLFKYILRFPGVWSIKPFYKLCELLKRNKTLRSSFSGK